MPPSPLYSLRVGQVGACSCAFTLAAACRPWLNLVGLASASGERQPAAGKNSACVSRALSLSRPPLFTLPLASAWRVAADRPTVSHAACDM
eukprot:scaffold26777_cov101-Isochrysis_galbana.AAC.3